MMCLSIIGMFHWGICLFCFIIELLGSLIMFMSKTHSSHTGWKFHIPSN